MTSCNDDELLTRLRDDQNRDGRAFAAYEAADRICQLTEQLKEAEWRPIESAPLETRIMLWCPEQQRKDEPPRFTFGRVVQFSRGERKVYGEGMSGDWLFTHWMPLPDPPSRRTSINGTR